MGLSNRGKYLLKNTTIFTVANFSTKLVMFFLIPLYTWKLSTVEYGKADLLVTICSFLFPLLTFNIVEAVFRFSMDKNKNEDKIVANGIICILACTFLGLFVIPILKCINGFSDLAYTFYAYLVTLSISQTLLALLKGQEKLKQFSIGNVINVVSLLGLSFLFLAICNMSVQGFFLAYIVSGILTAIYCIFAGKIKLSLSKKNFDKKLLKRMLKYSVVLIPTSFMWWIINSSDRVMIASFIGESANGIYAISYKLPSLLTMLATIFNQAWVFSAITEKDSDDYEKYTNDIFGRLFAILALSAVGLLGILRPLFSVYVSPDYFVAWKYVPFLIFGYLFMTLATFISTSYNVHKDSKGFLFSGLAGAITNIALNAIFIPLFNVYGAALATACSYVIVFVYRIIDTRKYVKIHVNVFRYSFLLLMVLISCALMYIENDAIEFAWCLVAAGVIIAMNRGIVISLVSLVRKKIIRKS